MIRVAAIATPARRCASPQAWADGLEALVRAAAEDGAGIALLGEYVTAPLIEHDARWQRWTAPWTDLAIRLARSYRLHLVAGTHLVEDGGRRVNRALIAHPDGSLAHQDKLHPTPWERGWGVAATDAIRIADLGLPAAVLICYDIEFPEACRAAAAAGAELLLVPSWTDDRAGFHRVRRCAAARAVEDVAHVAHAPLIGGLDAPGFESAVGAAAIITPCDDGFPQDGIAAEGGWNAVGAVVAAIDPARLRAARAAGTVTPLADRRAADAYRIAIG